MDKTSFMGLGYAAEKLLEHYTKAPRKIDISSPDSINEFISGAPTPFSNNQLLMAPLLGAGAGGLAGWAFGNPKARKREMLVGALGGGMIGGGAALGYKYLGGLGAQKARELNTVPADVIQQTQDNIKLLEEHQKNWNPFKGGIIESNTGRPIADTEIPFRIEKFKKLQELYPQIPEAAGKYQQQRGGITGGLQGGIAGLTLAKILDTIMPYNATKNTKPKKDKKDMDAKTHKQADSTAAIMGGLGGLVPGGLTGAGAGGLYGLLSGAYQAEKGKKLRGAVTGLGRGLVGGGLIGGGIGAGAGAGAGLTLPRGLFSPFGATLGGLQVAADPLGTASRAALGGVGGAALGGYLGNKARKATLGEPKKDEEKSEEKSEKKDNKPEEKEERKAAALLAALKEAELKLAPLAGVKKPKNDKGTSLNQVLEEARKKREEKEKNMPQQNKAAARGDMAKKYLTHREYHDADGKTLDQHNMAKRLQKVRSWDAYRKARQPDRYGDSYRKDMTAVERTESGAMRPADKTVHPAADVPKRESKKSASAYEFGKMVKSALGLQEIGNYVKDTWNSPGVQGFVNDPTTRAGLTYGGIGAGLGGLYGLINPGEYEDEMGNVRRRGRLSGALRGALGGGAIGGLAGAGAQEGRFQYLKQLMNQRAGFPNAMGGLDRSEALENAEAFAKNNPSAVGALGTSPLQSAHNAYSAVGNAVKGFIPKRMGKAPPTGVETPVKAPEVKPAN